jgi:hypothetical protein
MGRCYTAPMVRVILKKLLLVCTLVLLTGGTALAAGRSPVAMGSDVSYPQCGKKLPTGQAFGIVGVNGGVASNSNLCFAGELAWARFSSGAAASVAKAALYVNTGNPGGLGTTTWPKSGANSYGICNGSNSLACAYQFGWNMAFLDATSRGVLIPGMFTWWLDVETANSWDYSSGGVARNVADLEGMTAYFEGLGARVGVYSSGKQWMAIVGSSVPVSSDLQDLVNWRPGAMTKSAAMANCSLAPLTPGGKVGLTQYGSAVYDYDITCP